MFDRMQMLKNCGVIFPNERRSRHGLHEGILHSSTRATFLCRFQASLELVQTVLKVVRIGRCVVGCLEGRRGLSDGSEIDGLIMCPGRRRRLLCEGSLSIVVG